LIVALALDDDLPIMVALVMPSSIMVAVTVAADDEGAVAMIFTVGPHDLSLAIPVAPANPHVQFLGDRRRRNANGRKGGNNESTFTHFLLLSCW
jgi:hypothetical protein